MEINTSTQYNEINTKYLTTNKISGIIKTRISSTKLKNFKKYTISTAQLSDITEKETK